ncbi:hypothetical protein HK104_004975 [Borealophlyctis nickersoniae]|nr:hypothetical protein HK104_004974 [Borealophlyctis nickersoniae]KAJ3292845.1 hypothetical protein HK104_004975 [Borealophlyctis nickersoniae]
MIAMVTMDGSLSLVRIADNHALKVVDNNGEDYILAFSMSRPMTMTRTHLLSYSNSVKRILVFDLKTLHILYHLAVGDDDEIPFPVDQMDEVVRGCNYLPTDDGTMLFKHMDGRSILLDPKRSSPWLLRPPATSRTRTTGEGGVYVVARDYPLQEDGKRTMAAGETVVLWQELPSETDG